MIVSSGDLGDIAIRDNGLPVMTFSSFPASLELFACTDPACTQ